MTGGRTVGAHAVQRAEAERRRETLNVNRRIMRTLQYLMACAQEKQSQLRLSRATRKSASVLQVANSLGGPMESAI